MEIVQAMLMKVCRLCTKEQSEEKRMYHIFKQNEQNMDSMLYRITWVTNLEYSSGDGLPPQICEECYTALNHLFTFKKRCYASDRELRQLIQNLKGEIGDLTTAEDTEEESHTDNEDHSHTKTLVTLSDSEEDRGLNETRNMNAEMCNTTQLGESEGLSNLTHKNIDEISDNEMSILEPIVSISYQTNECSIAAHHTTATITDDIKMNEECDKIDTSQSTSTLLQIDSAQRVCSYVLHKKHAIVETKVESDNELESMHTQITEASTTNNSIDESITINKEPNSKVLNDLSKSPGQPLQQSLTLEKPCQEIKLYCFQCKASYTDSDELNVHLTSHAERTTNMFSCSAGQEITKTTVETTIKCHSSSENTVIPTLEQCESNVKPSNEHSDKNILIGSDTTQTTQINNELDPKVATLNKDNILNTTQLNNNSSSELTSLNKNSEPIVTPLTEPSDPNLTQTNKDFDPTVVTFNQNLDLNITFKQINHHSNPELTSLNNNSPVKLVNTSVSKSKDTSTPERTTHVKDTFSSPLINYTKTIDTSNEGERVKTQTKTQDKLVPESECDLIKKCFVSLKVVLERCDTHGDFSLQGKNINVLKTNKINKVNGKEDTCRRKDKQSIIKNQSTKGNNSKNRKDDSGYTGSRPSNNKKGNYRSKQQKPLDDGFDLGASTSKYDLDDLRRPGKHRNSSGDLKHKGKSKISKMGSQQEGKETSLLGERRDLSAVLSRQEENTGELAHSQENSAERSGNDNSKNMLHAEASLEYQERLSKKDFSKHVVYTNGKSKLGEKADSNEKYSLNSKQKCAKDSTLLGKTESKTPNKDKMPESVSEKYTKSTISVKKKKQNNSKSQSTSREIPPEILDFNSLTKMLKSHFETKTFPCTYCDKVLSRAPLLKAHLRSHTGETPFSCHDCGKKYSEKRLLKRHIRILHIPEKPFKCETCPKSYITRHELEKHVRMHTGYRPYKCSLCPKTYTISQNLHTHQLSHLGERNFHCHLCGKSFWLNSILKSHLLTHNTEKKFSCAVCEKAFASVKSLKIHERTHTHERIFKCKLCPAAYVQPGTLRDHMRKHNGDTFNCMICGKSFVKKTKLREHLSAHSGKRRFACVPCGKTFIHKASLLKHERRKHINGKPPVGLPGTGPELKNETTYDRKTSLGLPENGSDLKKETTLMENHL